MKPLNKDAIPFNRAFVPDTLANYLQEAVSNGHLSGNGPFTKRCQAWLEATLPTQKALLTPSGTAALEMAALLLGVKPGDEVIMPSFTYVSTANAFALRGAVPVFVEIDPNTLNICPNAVEAAVTEKTRGVVAIHYAGISAPMDALQSVANRYGLWLVEDAAQALMGKSGDRLLGSIGTFAAVSFHETKNLSCGEGGALLVNNPDDVDAALQVWHKGTNRKDFEAGKASCYTWQGLGSSYAPSELTAAALWAQLELADAITTERKRLWAHYHQSLAALETEGFLRRPVVPVGVEHNGHTYYVLLSHTRLRDNLMQALNTQGINAVFHYVPLHSSSAGKQLGKTGQNQPLYVTEDVSAHLLRLPLWVGMQTEQIDWVVAETDRFLRAQAEVPKYVPTATLCQ